MIKQAAILFNGVIFMGDRHKNIRLKNKHLNGLRPGGVEGFVTNRGLFVDRKEAAKIAFYSGQIKTKKEKLRSEDLY